MKLAVGIMIVFGIGLWLLFLYALMKIAHQSDERAGYAEGMLYQKPSTEEGKTT